MRSTISIAHSPQAAWQCVTLPTAPCPQQQCSRAHTVQCGAEHQAVRHHTEGTGGAARHAGCSGQMRPCVTARRRRQGSVGQVRECTGPAMPQHTYTQRAHNTHSPARLPVPVGRHPGLCLLVTAPSAHHTTPHPTTPHHPTPQHPTPPHTTAPNSTPHDHGLWCLWVLELVHAKRRWCARVRNSMRKLRDFRANLVRIRVCRHTESPQ